MRSLELAEPILRTESVLSVPPDHDEESTGSFIVSQVIVADVFGDSEPEIIVVQRHACCTPSLVQVRDFHFDVLFEMWHCGPIYASYWMPDEKLLVCGGDRKGMTGDPKLMGFGAMDRYAMVVFAIKPKLHETFEWVGGRWDGIDERKDCEWYRWVGPPNVWNELGLKLSGIGRSSDASFAKGYVQVTYDLIDKPSGVALTIDRDGNVVHRQANGRYNSLVATGKLTPLHAIDLVAAPPRPPIPHE